MENDFFSGLDLKEDKGKGEATPSTQGEQEPSPLTGLCDPRAHYSPSTRTSAPGGRGTGT